MDKVSSYFVLTQKIAYQTSYQKLSLNAETPCKSFDNITSRKEEIIHTHIEYY